MEDEATAFAAADAPAHLAPLVEGLCRVARGLARRIARGPLAGPLSADVGRNADGDGQKSLDVMADEAFRAEATRRGVRWYASEEQEEVVELDPAGRFALTIDPLDGSSNIDTNVSIGSIFSIYAAEAEGPASVLRSPRDQLVAGYFIYGPRTCLVVTFGADVRQYVLDPDSGAFEATGEAMRVPDSSNEFAINASNYRHWSRPIRAYIDDCLSGADGPREADFNMRWIASLVAETHRILVRGGLFLYPEDQRPAYRSGRLRMVYECAPIALLVERAGGRATDGRDDILDQQPRGLHARTPFVFGSRDKVTQVSAYHDLPEEEVSALFGHRGLFRA